jgi:DNA-binding XRE family transcriptional regulator
MLAAMAGFSQERAAALIGISETTLRAHLHDDWQRGADRASLKVVQNLYRMATATNADRTAVTAAIFWTKTRLGWRDRDPHPVEVETEAPADGVVRVRLRLFDSTPNAD